MEENLSERTRALTVTIVLLPMFGLLSLLTEGGSPGQRSGPPATAPPAHTAGAPAPAATNGPATNGPAATHGPAATKAPPPADPTYDVGWPRVATAAFAGTSLDTSRWSVYNGASSNPIQSRSAAFVTVAGGSLNLFTRAAMGSGLCWCQNRPESLYGRWEIKERMSPGADHGQATLLWPADNNWPSEGEIDVSEMNTPQRQLSATTVHYSDANLQLRATSAADFTQWHVFAVEWEPDAVRVWRDGVPVLSTTDAAAIPHTPMYLAMQAGPNVTHPNGSSATLQVAWVKVFSP